MRGAGLQAFRSTTRRRRCGPCGARWARDRPERYCLRHVDVPHSCKRCRRTSCRPPASPLTPPSPITAGNRLIVEVGVWSASAATALSVTDSAGNRYTELLQFKASAAPSDPDDGLRIAAGDERDDQRVDERNRLHIYGHCDELHRNRSRLGGIEPRHPCFEPRRPVVTGHRMADGRDPFRPSEERECPAAFIRKFAVA